LRHKPHPQSVYYKLHLRSVHETTSLRNRLSLTLHTITNPFSQFLPKYILLLHFLLHSYTSYFTPTLLTHSKPQAPTMLAITMLTLLLPIFAAADYLGGIDMSRACQDQYGGEWYAYVQDNNCSGWKCQARDGEATPRGIDTPRACVNQHGAGATALCGGLFPGGAYDWGCFR
jgi:hypothetical protein